MLHKKKAASTNKTCMPFGVAVASAVVGLHAVFTTTQSRQLAHHWRPVTVFEPEQLEPALLTPDRLRRYTRAIIALSNEDCEVFGVCAHVETAVCAPRLCLYVVRPVACSDVASHVVTAVLWHDDTERAKREAARDFLSWHALAFESTPLLTGRELEVSDRRILTSARQR